jgi:hypothetical protein
MKGEEGGEHLECHTVSWLGFGSAFYSVLCDVERKRGLNESDERTRERKTPAFLFFSVFHLLCLQSQSEKTKRREKE